ncbi:FGGY family carbohydrate kinase [Thermodesulfobacteriota bacterium]
MASTRLSLGIDLSTQSLSAIVLDIDKIETVADISLNYLRDERLNCFGIQEEDYIIPPRIEGEADQPPAMFFAALDSLFDDLRKAIDPEAIVVINVSGQQHGHVYLNDKAPERFALLQKDGAEGSDLVFLLEGCLAYDRAPIWMTSNTRDQAAFIRDRIGGKEHMIKISGSDAQLRFTGIVARNIAERFRSTYERTATIQLLSSIIPSILTANPYAPTDYGNGCGMALMNYKRRDWDDRLLSAVSDGLPGGFNAFRRKLPSIVSPDTVVGTISRYFVRKYGLSPQCKVVAGSGDNPQSKVMIAGDLLSLGTSIVNMVATDGMTFDMSGSASAMYDGVGRPFMFGCRTNGALVWDKVRARYGLSREDYANAESALQDTPLGRFLVFWQPRTESFPVSDKFDLWRASDVSPGLGHDYTGLIESCLAAVYHHSKGFSVETTDTLYVTGGATANPGIMRRIAGIWKCRVIPMEKMGAALGAATSAVSALFKSEGEKFDIDSFTESIVSRGREIRPAQEDIEAFHGPGQYMERFVETEMKLISMYR